MTKALARKPLGKPFKKGQSGNPAGRPKGSRNRLSEAFLADFCDLWDKHGRAALEAVAKTDPSTFVRAAVSVLPKHIDVDVREAVYVVRMPAVAPDMKQWQETYGKK